MDVALGRYVAVVLAAVGLSVAPSIAVSAAPAASATHDGSPAASAGQDDAAVRGQAERSVAAFPLDLYVDLSAGAPRQRVRVYVRQGPVPPGRPHHVPSGHPSYQCAYTCPEQHTIVIPHVPDLTIYGVSVYSTSNGKTIRSAYAQQQVRTGAYLGDNDRLSSRHRTHYDLQIDKNGTRHVVTAHSYLTRSPGAAHWTRTPLADGPDCARFGSRMAPESGLSTNGNKVFFVTEPGDGNVYATEASIGATHLPDPTIVGPEDCGDIYDRSAALNGAVALPHGRIGVLIGNSFLRGRPGGKWTSTSLPDSSAPGTRILTLTRDPVTGVITVVGAAASSTPNVELIWSRHAGHGWTAPTSLRLRSSALKDTASITSDDGQTWMAFSAPASPIAASTSQGGRILLYHRHDNGPWSVQHVPHRVGSLDFDPLVEFNSASHHLHIVYAAWVNLRDAPADDTMPFVTRRSGLEAQKLVDGHWTKPRQLTHSYLDRAEGLAFTPAGRAVAVLTRY